MYFAVVVGGKGDYNASYYMYCEVNVVYCIVLYPKANYTPQRNECRSGLTDYGVQCWGQ